MFSGFGTVSNDTCVTMGIFPEMVTLFNMYAYKCNQPSTSAREQKSKEDESKEFIYLLQGIEELLGESIFFTY